MYDDFTSAFKVKNKTGKIIDTTKGGAMDYYHFIEIKIIPYKNKII